MKKKIISLSLLIIGTVLICLPIILSVIETANKNIIGGADFPTFLFVFSNERGGLYLVLGCVSIIIIIAAMIVHFTKSNNGRK